MTVLGYVYSQYKDNILLVRICNYCSIHASEIFSGLCTLNPLTAGTVFCQLIISQLFGLQPKSQTPITVGDAWSTRQVVRPHVVTISKHGQAIRREAPHRDTTEGSVRRYPPLENIVC